MCLILLNSLASKHRCSPLVPRGERMESLMQPWRGNRPNRNGFDERFRLSQSAPTVRPTTLTGMALACVTLAAGAQTTNLTTRSLTLRECIDLALEHNLAI